MICTSPVPPISHAAIDMVPTPLPPPPSLHPRHPLPPSPHPHIPHIPPICDLNPPATPPVRLVFRLPKPATCLVDGETALWRAASARRMTAAPGGAARIASTRRRRVAARRRTRRSTRPRPRPPWRNRSPRLALILPYHRHRTRRRSPRRSRDLQGTTAAALGEEARAEAVVKTTRGGAIRRTTFGRILGTILRRLIRETTLAMTTPGTFPGTRRRLT